MNSNTFISKADFDKKVNESKIQIMSWKELTENKIYKIDSFTVKKTKYGNKDVLHLSDKEGEKTNVWSIDHLTKKLPKTIKNPIYVRPLGLKPHSNDPSQKYHAFDFVEDIVMNSTFISEADFDKKVNESKIEIISWNKLTENEIYKIDSFTVKKTKYGNKDVLHLSTEDGKTFNVWSIDHLTKKLPKTIKNQLYVRPLGLKPHTNDSSKKYHAFDLVEKQQKT